MYRKDHHSQVKRTYPVLPRTHRDRAPSPDTRDRSRSPSGLGRDQQPDAGTTVQCCGIVTPSPTTAPESSANAALNTLQRPFAALRVIRRPETLAVPMQTPPISGMGSVDDEFNDDDLSARDLEEPLALSQGDWDVDGTWTKDARDSASWITTGLSHAGHDLSAVIQICRFGLRHTLLNIFRTGSDPKNPICDIPPSSPFRGNARCTPPIHSAERFCDTKSIAKSCRNSAGEVRANTFDKIGLRDMS